MKSNKQNLLALFIIGLCALPSCKKEEPQPQPQPVHVSSVSISSENLTLTEGESQTLTATISPSNADNRKVIWSSSDASIASVDGGKVTAIKAGSTTITVKSEDGGKTATCKVAVTQKSISVESISLDKTEISMQKDDEITLIATISPSDATNKNVLWSSSDTQVATVEGGKVKAIKEGKATITAKSDDGGKTATCTVTVTAKVISVDGISLDKETLELIEGDESTLIATITPENASNKKVSWTSSNPSVASVDNGKVTAVKEGTATITTKSDDGEKAASCKVTVISKGIPAGALSGVFTVSDDGQGNVKKVLFSKGNLYAKYENSKWNWKFHDKQYTFLAADMEVSGSDGGIRTVSSDDTEIDLFTWGFNASTSLLPTGSTFVTGHIAKGDLQLVYDKKSSEGGDDWGVAYCESNEKKVGTWRTLTAEEWHYLFSYDGYGIGYDNETRRGKYKNSVTVCGSENCVVLLPDTWDESVISLATFAATTEYSSTTTPTWSAMEEAGAVCLPAAGYRLGSQVYYSGSSGHYWSSTACSSTQASSVGFWDRIDVSVSGRACGSCVRLITESK